MQAVFNFVILVIRNFNILKNQSPTKSDSITKNSLHRLLFWGRYVTIFTIVVFALVASLFVNYAKATQKSEILIHYDFNSPVSDLYIPEPDREVYTVAEEALAEYNQEQAAIEARRKMLEEKINRTLAYLQRVKSPVANEEIATIIVDLSEQNGADYRVLLAIMTIESGSCRQSFAHNCFGYLNGVKYPSYEVAFQDLVPKVSRQYAARYGWDFTSLSKAYGQHNWELHSQNMLRVANSI